MDKSIKSVRSIEKGHPGERITLLRKRAGLSQHTLATRAHITPTTLSEIEAGGGYRHPTIARIAAVLGVTANDLMTPIS